MPRILVHKGHAMQVCIVLIRYFTIERHVVVHKRVFGSKTARVTVRLCPSLGPGRFLRGRKNGLVQSV